jgi:hypothetical protein
MNLITISIPFTKAGTVAEAYASWTNPSGVIASGVATTSLYWDGQETQESFEDAASDYIYASEADVDYGLDSTYIYKVEVCIQTYADITASGVEEKIIGVYPWNPEKGYYDEMFYYGVFPTNVDLPWYIDITNTASFPGSGNWDWYDLADLRIYLDFGCYTVSGSWNISVDNISLRITYSETPLVFYGLESKNADDEQILKVTERISRVFFKKEVAADDSGNEDFTIPSNYTYAVSYAYALDATTGGMPHTVGLLQVGPTTGNIEWTANSKSAFGHLMMPSVDSLIVVIGY